MQVAFFLAAILAATPPTPLEEAARLASLGDTQAAIERLQGQASGGESLDPDAAFALGVWLLDSGKADRALPHLERTARANHLLSGWASVKLVEAHFGRGDLAAAEGWIAHGTEVLGSQHTHSPALAELHRWKAQIWGEDPTRSREAAGAWNAFQQASPDHPLLREAAWREAEAWEAAGDRQAAYDAFRRIWWIDPGAPRALEARERFERLGALSTVRSAATPSMEEHLAHIRRLRAAGRNEEAAEESRALQSKATVEARRELMFEEAGALYNARENEASLRVAEKLLQDPGEWRCPAEAMKARLFWIRLSRSSEAVSVAKRLAQDCAWSAEDAKEGGEEGAWILANLLLRGKNPSDARPHLRALTERDNRRQEAAAWKLGLLLFQERKWEDAADVFETLAEATDSAGYRSAGLYWAARSRLQAGEPARARQHLLAQVEERPRHYYGYRAANLLSTALGEQPPRQSAAILEEEKLPEPVLGAQGWKRAERLRRLGLVDLAGREILALTQEFPEAEAALALRAATAYSGTRWAGHGVRLMLKHFKDLQEREVSTVPEGLDPTEVRRAFFPNPFSSLYEERAELENLRPYLPLAITRRESLFDPEIRSWAGAVGLMQLMPATAAEEAVKMKLTKPSPADLTDPILNVKLGVHHLSGLVNRFEELPAAIAAYNAGAGRVSGWLKTKPLQGPNAWEQDLWIDTIPVAQTRLYVKGVLRAMWEYESLYPELDPDKAKAASSQNTP